MCSPLTCHAIHVVTRNSALSTFMLSAFGRQSRCRADHVVDKLLPLATLAASCGSRRHGSVVTCSTWWGAGLGNTWLRGIGGGSLATLQALLCHLEDTCTARASTTTLLFVARKSYMELPSCTNDAVTNDAVTHEELFEVLTALSLVVHHECE